MQMGVDKVTYPAFEWVPGIPILDETQQQAPYIIDEDELKVEDFAINDDGYVQEEDQDEKGLRIIE